MQELINAGAVAGALATIIGLAASIAKIIKGVRKRRADAEKRHAEVLGKIDSLSERIDSEIGDLQYERLSQAHDYYLDRGWCPSSKKQQLCNMYRSYTAKGRNHLSAHYEAEILSLPYHPTTEQ